MSAIVEVVFPSRAEAVLALHDPAVTGDALRGAALAVEEGALAFGRVPGAKDWRAFASALEILAMLTDWAAAIDTAQVDADRFLRAARQKLNKLAQVAEQTDYHQAVCAALSLITGEFDPGSVPAQRLAIAALPMPVAIIADPEPPRRIGFDDPEPRAEDLSVAFLEFTINGAAAANLHSLRPNQVHDLGLTIRVSRWPDHADSLSIIPVSIEPQSMWELPRFTFARPDGDPPYTFRREGRMIVQASQGFDARPLEFVYAAEFQPASREARRVVVAGQRRLRLDGLDIANHGVSGYPSLDRRVLDIRNQLRELPHVAEDDIRAALPVLGPLANLVGSAVQDALYPKPIYEDAFEADVRQRLRAVPMIGAELEQQAHAGGGRTDLSFRGIRIELKSERKKRVLPEDAAAYADQAVSYAVASGKRLAVLCVLDCSPKKTPPLPVESCLLLQSRDNDGGPVHIVTLLVQGGLPKPSSLSR
ncbi:MAG: hypothetical protein K2Y27_31720 [Xanthobacteraceae bacterium]|nr:hypothetical protein [Xanthobacteraceae bacterium]